MAPQHKPSILIADDEPGLRLLVRATLESDAYSIVEASDGEAAWQLLQRHRPRVALLDMQMPGRTGLELTRIIKATPELAETRVILLSAKTQATDIEAGLTAGADRYLTKPFSPLELIKVIEQALEGSGERQMPPLQQQPSPRQPPAGGLLARILQVEAARRTEDA